MNWNFCPHCGRTLPPFDVSPYGPTAPALPWVPVPTAPYVITTGASTVDPAPMIPPVVPMWTPVNPRYVVDAGPAATAPAIPAGEPAVTPYRGLNSDGQGKIGWGG